jgi:RNA polymerase sigma-70 factor, ECF subfamily
MENGDSTDARTLALARAGDRVALEALLASVAPSIHRFGLRMCKNVHDADDVLQDTLLAVARHLGEFEGRSSLSSWVFALTRSACARRRRGLKNKPSRGGDDELAEAVVDTSASPEARVADQELAAALSNALDNLPDDYREVILLRDIEQLTAPEAASALGISVDAIKSRLHRAREALRAALRPMLEAKKAVDVDVGVNVAKPDVAAAARCPNVAVLWSQKLEGDLSQSDCSAMEQHLVGCAACGAACDALKRALLACQRLRTESVPSEVQSQVKAAIRAWAAEKATTR